MQANKIIILTAPSGTGKTSIAKYLLEKYKNLTFSISAATRSPRANEVNGKDYYFISVDDFINKINNHQFAEWEMVYEGKYYGTLKAELERIWSENKTPLLDIDVKGAISVQEQYKQQTLSIFVMPPSIDALADRLNARGTETPESLAMRIDKANFEISHSHHFSKIVVNDDLQKACEEVETLINNFLQNN